MSWIKRLFEKLFGVKCPSCHGSGLDIVWHGITGACATCDGRGRIKKESEE